MVVFTTGLLRAFTMLMVIANLQNLDSNYNILKIYWIMHFPPPPQKQSFLHGISLKSVFQKICL